MRVNHNGKKVFLLDARHNTVYKAFFKLELGALKAFRQLLMNRAFNNARPCKADQRIRLRRDNIT